MERGKSNNENKCRCKNTVELLLKAEIITIGGIF
jgi:hypothetical protein